MPIYAGLDGDKRSAAHWAAYYGRTAALQVEPGQVSGKERKGEREEGTAPMNTDGGSSDLLVFSFFSCDLLVFLSFPVPFLPLQVLLQAGIQTDLLDQDQRSVLHWAAASTNDAQGACLQVMKGTPPQKKERKVSDPGLEDCHPVHLCSLAPCVAGSGAPARVARRGSPSCSGG